MFFGMNIDWEKLILGSSFGGAWDHLLTEDQIRKLNDIRGEENIDVPPHIRVIKMQGWIDHVGPRDGGEDHYMQAVYFENVKANRKSIAIKNYTTGKKYLVSGIKEEPQGNLRSFSIDAINNNKYQLFKLWPSELIKTKEFWMKWNESRRTVKGQTSKGCTLR